MEVAMNSMAQQARPKLNTHSEYLRLPEGRHPELVEHQRPGEQEHALDVEDHEQECEHVVADLGLGPGGAHRIHAALVGGQFARAGPVRAKESVGPERDRHEGDREDQKGGERAVGLEIRGHRWCRF
jgi:hypothetical protein